MPAAILERDADAKSGFISGIASSPAIDSYGHLVRRGAFDASIARRGLTGPQGVKLLSAHAGFPVGVIKSLRTVGQDLRIEAELNLELQSARDLHSITKHSGPLNFSVGFKLEDFDVVEEKNLKPGEPWLIIKRGDLHEVSIVTFPACESATMDAKSRSMAPWVAKALAELQRTQALLDPKPVDRLADLKARQAALASQVRELQLALRKRVRDEETLREWRHWSDARARSLRGRMNI